MPNTEPKRIHVAVGVIAQGEQILLARRADHQHQGGLWEFPGGKVESGESVAEALSRELQEELSIVVEQSQPLLTIEHNYPDKSVLLDVWFVPRFSGEPRGVEGQPLQWVSVQSLHTVEFPKANIEIVNHLQNLDSLS